MRKNTGTRVRVHALPQRSPLARRVQRVSPSGIRRFFEMVIGMEDILSLAVGEPDFVAPWRVREAAIFSLEEGDTSYTSNWGLLELRQAIAGKMRQDFGVDYDPRNQIVVTTGVSEGLDLAIRSVTDPGDEVLLVEPAYVSYAPTVHFAEGTPVPVAAPESRGFIPRAEDIRRAITPRTKAILLNYPNNPTGAVLG
ncbi:MAG: aminotransferase class I/II-fold pyridoxal phosphate-dependent enzyme, partial [Euryarchaeota archaeon]|nr:aminotransferase class I/II-fold pyridoxal phosphate-dependent enzyme [Euryarchaeota archaeon]